MSTVENRPARPLSQEQTSAIRDFASSELFLKLFKSGMAMVEETATYLDGKGRQQSRGLPRKVALAYAGESMRLTTRLMQVASWLLVQRAVKEGEIAPIEASGDKYRLGASEICRGPQLEAAHLLPDDLLDLIRRSENLYDRIERLDRSLYRDQPEQPEDPLLEQRRKLAAAFGLEAPMAAYAGTRELD